MGHLWRGYSFCLQVHQVRKLDGSLFYIGVFDKYLRNCKELEITTYFYIRVCTDLQNYANQRFELETFARKNNIKVDEIVEEAISSRKPLLQRKLGKLLEKLAKSDKIIAAILSARASESHFQQHPVSAVIDGCGNLTLISTVLFFRHRLT